MLNNAANPSRKRFITRAMNASLTSVVDTSRSRLSFLNVLLRYGSDRWPEAETEALKETLTCLIDSLIRGRGKRMYFYA